MRDFISLALLAALLTVLGIALVAWCARILLRHNQRQRQEMEVRQKQRDRARIESIEAALQEFLTELELPQFEDKMKLEGAARLLRIVLVEQLMRGPRVR